MIGGSTSCKFANCTECNAAPKAASGPHGDGCGWCPSFCGGAGKCMIGKTAPIFETCRVDPSTGFRFRQCRVENVQLAPVIGAVVSGVCPVSSFFLTTITFRNPLFPFRPARGATFFFSAQLNFRQALVGVYCLYSLLRWIRRRQGTFAVYLKKKRFDITCDSHVPTKTL